MGRGFCRRRKSISRRFLPASPRSSATPPSGTSGRWNSPARRGSLIFRTPMLRCSIGCGNLAVECWRLFDLAGYARVDFRVDSRGQPWILEINANPCLSPDAGFAAALCAGRICRCCGRWSGFSSCAAAQGTRVSGQRTGNRGRRARGQSRASDVAGRTSSDSAKYRGIGTSGRRRPAAKGKRRTPAIKLRTKVRKDDARWWANRYGDGPVSRR